MVAAVVMAACAPGPAAMRTAPVWLARTLRRMQDRYEARRSAAALGRLTNDGLRDIGLTPADVGPVLRIPRRR